LAEGPVSTNLAESAAIIHGADNADATSWRQPANCSGPFGAPLNIPQQ
jgi:hypothetical protein